jgi:hypothetical protein
MKHLYLVFLIALLYTGVLHAQQCITQNTVNITGRVTVGKGVCTNAANSSLLELGLDGVNRAFRLVRGDTAVFNTTITNGSGGNGYGLMCYQISDEGLYYHNNTRWVHLLDANLDKYVTGASYNSLTGDLTLTRTAPLSNLVVNLSALADNIYTVDGVQDDPTRTYDMNNSTLTFVNGNVFGVEAEQVQLNGYNEATITSGNTTYVSSAEYTNILADQKDSAGVYRIGGLVTIGERHTLPLSPSDSIRIVASETIILSVLDADSPFSPVTNKQILLKGLKESNCDTVVTIRTGGKLEYTKSTDLLCNAVQQAPIATYASGVYLLGTGGGGGASIPPTWIGWDFDIPTDFAPATSALNLGFHHIYLNGMLYPYPPATGSPSTPTLGTNDTGINAHISASLVLAGFGANDIIWVSNPDNTVTIWVNPAYPVNGNEFWCGSMTPDDYNKQYFPVIPTTHAPPTGSGCALYDISALTPIPTQREVFYVAAPATSISTTLTLSTNQLHNYIYDDGQLLAYGYDYTVSGSTITWIGGVLNRSGVFQIVINQ